MKYLIQTLILFLLAASTHGQCIRLTKLHGDTTYGTLGVNDTTKGLVTGGGAPGCGGPTTSYRVINGSYVFNFSKPVFSIRVDLWGMDEVETIKIKVNGVAHAITPSEMIMYTNCGSIPAPSITLVSGELHAPSGFLEFDGGAFELKTCDGIDSFEVIGFSTGTGISFDICIDTVRQPYCLFAHATTPLCTGDKLDLWATGDSASGTASYYWYGPAGFTSTKKYSSIPSVTLANAGKYRVVRSVGAIHDTDTVTVIIRPTPVLSINHNSPICYGVGNTITLDATPYVSPETFSWTGPNSFTSTNQNNIITPISDADTGVYTVVANLNGCTNTASVRVGYAPIPAPPLITGPTHYCTGQIFVPFTITGGTGAIFTWFNVGVGGTGSGTAPVINTAGPTGSVTTVWASQKVLGCESPRSSITVTVDTTPVPPVVIGTTSYCQHEVYVPPLATGVGVLWYPTPTGGTGSITTPTVNTAVPGVYNLYSTQTTTGCESPRGVFTITVQAKPSLPVVINDPGIYCVDQPFVPFKVIAGTSISWYTSMTGGGGTSIPPVLSTSVPGIQTVYVSQTKSGCESGRLAVSIKVQEQPKAEFDYKVNYGCKSDTVHFINKSKFSDVFQWKFGDGFSSIADTPSHVYLIPNIDTVTLKSSMGSCSDSITLYIDLRHPLHAKFDVDTNLICQGSSITFTDTASVGTDSTRLWSYGDYELHPPVTGPTTTHIYPVSGVFDAYLVVTDFRKCTDTMFRRVYVDSISPISIGLTDTVICQGTHITMKGYHTEIGLTRLLWDLGTGDSIAMENPLVYAYTQDGKFTITERAYYRVCPNTYTSRDVVVIPQPKINIGSDATICKGSESLTLSDNINSENQLATWMWNTGEKTSAITVVAPGTYTATVRVRGCYASATVVVKNDCYMNIPNAFTPNEDGANDYFYPTQYLSSGLTEFKMSIFNRWGIKVFETNNLNGSGWDGKLNGVMQPEGVYIYMVEGVFKDGQHEKHQGNVTLLR